MGHADLTAAVAAATSSSASWAARHGQSVP